MICTSCMTGRKLSTPCRGYLAENTPRPGLILLDLDMPGKNGLETLAEIKSDPGLQAIPAVVLTSSRDEDALVPRL